MTSTSTTKLAVATAAGSLAQVAGAAIIVGDFSSSPYTSTVGSSIYIDFDSGTAANASIDNFDATLLFEFNSNEKPTVRTSGGWRVNVSGNYASKLTSGAPVAASGPTLGYMENYGRGWDGTNGQGYLGFHNVSTNNQAWASINYNDVANTIQLLAIGYNDSGSLTAGQIPEPASAAALAALFAGGAAAFQRRRRAA